MEKSRWVELEETLGAEPAIVARGGNSSKIDAFIEAPSTLVCQQGISRASVTCSWTGGLHAEASRGGSFGPRWLRRPGARRGIRPGQRPRQVHEDAFNNRQWSEVKALLANGSDSSIVPMLLRSIADRMRSSARSSSRWRTSSTSSSPSLTPLIKVTGKDGRVVERGAFAVTAGASDDSCYAGSYMMTWVPQAGDGLEAAADRLAGPRDRPRQLQVIERPARFST